MKQVLSYTYGLYQLLDALVESKTYSSQCPTLNIFHTLGSPKKDVSNNYSLAICYIAIENGHRNVVSVPNGAFHGFM